MANLRQQGIDNNQYLPPFNNKYNPLAASPFITNPPKYASPPIQPKTLAMSSPSFQTPSIQAKLPNQMKSPSSVKKFKNVDFMSEGNLQKSQESEDTLQPSSQGTTVKMQKFMPDGTIQKSQESEATLAQQATQDTNIEENDDEVETIVATHVCNAGYSPSMPDELRMTPGDELIILEKFNDGWGFGQNTKGGVGVFPLDCVTYIDYGDKNKNNTPTMKQSNVNPKMNYVDINNEYNSNNAKKNYVPNIDNINSKPYQTALFDTNDLYYSDENDQIYEKYGQDNFTKLNPAVANYRSQYKNNYNQKIYTPMKSSMRKPVYK